MARQQFPQPFPASRLVRARTRKSLAERARPCRRAIAEVGISARDIAAIGIANQRETTPIWDRASSRPIHRVAGQCGYGRGTWVDYRR
jgi:glycerol kinase